MRGGGAPRQVPTREGPCGSSRHPTGRYRQPACYAPHQALSAAALGAAYVAPYLGRLDDAGRDGAAEVGQMQAALRAVGAPTRLLVASIRDAATLPSLAAGAGCDTFTFSPAVARALCAESLTDAAAADFERAAAAMGG